MNKELQTARDELNKIINEDRTNIQGLCIKENKTIAFNDYVNPEYVVNKVFWIPDDISFDNSLLLCLLDYVCQNLRNSLAKGVDMAAELEVYYKEYLNAGDQNKKTKFFSFMRTYQDFYGFLISIRNTIEQYYDFLFNL